MIELAILLCQKAIFQIKFCIMYVIKIDSDDDLPYKKKLDMQNVLIHIKSAFKACVCYFLSNFYFFSKW